MGLLILGILVFIGIMIIGIRVGDSWFDKLAGGIFIGIIAVALVCSITGGIVFSFEPQLKNVHEYKDYSIYSLSTIAGASGSFFLGCGSVNNKAYYYYYVKRGNGYQLDKVEVSDVIIVESDLKPRIRETIFIRDKGFFRFMLGELSYESTKEIHIPKGSIINSYNPNL